MEPDSLTVSITISMPNISSSGVAVNSEVLAMLLRIVSVTDAPSSTAPKNSHTAAISTAWKMVIALAPTEVPNELACKLHKVKTP